MKQILKNIFTIFSFIICIFSIILGVFVGISLSKTPTLEIKDIEHPLSSHIYSEDKKLLQTLGDSTLYTVTYEELPPQLIYALISIEDRNFFTHFGVDVKRTTGAFFKNIFSNKKEGGSSLTQQLIKNTLLTNEKTYKRKIQEAYLAIQLEKECSKEEILTLYFNHIYFEQSIPGVSYATKKYFGKSVSDLLLPECAILAGIVKSASIYNPMKYPTRVDERKNLVLKAMLEEHYITEKEYEIAVKTSTEDCIKKGNLTDESYPFQSYFDAVYLEVNDLIGINPFEYPLEITTYIDSALQAKLDEMVEDPTNWKDDTQQVGGVILRNEDAAVVGVVGGRAYHGYQLFHHGYALKRQPASTMKPIFSYLLAYEYLHYQASSSVIDEPYAYPGTQFSVSNADHSYMGNISVLDALGYSKNTCALYTLEQVTNHIGEERIISYLKDIQLWDEGLYSPSYGIGGMTYGISPLQLAGAYRMIANKGLYQSPSCIKQIVDGKTGTVLYERKKDEKRVVSEESAIAMEDTLVQMVEKNYYKIGVVSVNHVDIGAKTGTTGYDEKNARELDFPSYADKDSWLVGFSPSFTASFWSGWDNPKKGSHEYFAKNDERRKIPKYFFHETMDFLSKKEETFTIPEHYQAQYVITSDQKEYLPNEWIPSSKLVRVIKDSSSLVKEKLPLPTFYKNIEFTSFLFSNEVELHIYHETIQNPSIYENLYGKFGYQLSYQIDEKTISSFEFSDDIIIPYPIEKIKNITLTPQYEKNSSLHGETFPIVFQLSF